MSPRSALTRAVFPVPGEPEMYKMDGASLGESADRKEEMKCKKWRGWRVKVMEGQERRNEMERNGR